LVDFVFFEKNSHSILKKTQKLAKAGFSATDPL